MAYFAIHSPLLFKGMMKKDRKQHTCSNLFDKPKSHLVGGNQRP